MPLFPLLFLQSSLFLLDSFVSARRAMLGKLENVCVPEKRAIIQRLANIYISILCL